MACGSGGNDLRIRQVSVVVVAAAAGLVAEVGGSLLLAVLLHSLQSHLLARRRVYLQAVYLISILCCIA